MLVHASDSFRWLSSATSVINTQSIRRFNRLHCLYKWGCCHTSSLPAYRQKSFLSFSVFPVHACPRCTHEIIFKDSSLLQSSPPTALTSAAHPWPDPCRTNVNGRVPTLHLNCMTCWASDPETQLFMDAVTWQLHSDNYMAVRSLFFTDDLKK